MSNSKTLLLIDGHSMAYRAFFGMPVENFATTSGQATNAVYGFTSMLINMLRDEQPTHVAVAFDVSRHSFRTDVYPEYKATRSASPVEFKGQVELIKQVLDALNIIHVEKPGFEADDLLATLSTQAAAEGYAVRVCTGDRDALQLVTEQVTVLYPRKGVSDLVRMTPGAVVEKYQVEPARYPELAALVGETSDNLPGVPGVGPKTAAKWLAQYDGLVNLLAVADTVKGKAGEALVAHLDQVRRNRELNALVRDVELDVTIAELERRDWDREAVHTLFDALEFKVLRDRLFESLPLASAEPDLPEAGFTLTGDILGAGEVGPWLERRARGSRTGVDVVGHWGSGQGDIVGIALASHDDTACWIDVAELWPADEAALAAWLGDVRFGKVLHDAKGPLLALWQRGWDIAGLECDTIMAAYLLKPDQRTYRLDDLVIRHLHRELKIEPVEAPAESSDQLAFDFNEPKQIDISGPSMLRARAILALGEQLEHELAELGESATVLTTLEQPLTRTLAQMEATGIAVDTDILDQLRKDFDSQVSRAADTAFQIIGKEINLSSPKQLQAVLFDDLGMQKTRKTATGYTTDAESLQKLFEQTEHPFLQQLLLHRDAIKLRQTVDGLLAAIQDDGRIHTTYLQTVTGTGRLSSTDPNLQNIPIRTEAGRQIRKAFIVGSGYSNLMSADYSQIEMRIMAHVSQDQGLIDAFASGIDFHKVTASRVFGVPIEDVTAEQRSGVKAMNYGLAYGLSAYGLSSQLGVPASTAKSMMSDYFDSFGGVRDYLAEVVKKATKTGYTETMFGRRRYLPDLASPNRQRREMAERAALNAPIQGSAADIMKLAMLELERKLREERLASRMLLQVHDELIIEIAPGEDERITEVVCDSMEHAVELAIPLDVSVGIGHSWFDAAH